jgi:hypothetical protein
VARHVEPALRQRPNGRQPDSTRPGHLHAVIIGFRFIHRLQLLGGEPRYPHRLRRRHRVGNRGRGYVAGLADVRGHADGESVHGHRGDGHGRRQARRRQLAPDLGRRGVGPDRQHRRPVPGQRRPALAEDLIEGLALPRGELHAPPPECPGPRAHAEHAGVGHEHGWTIRRRARVGQRRGDRIRCLGCGHVASVSYTRVFRWRCWC